MHLEGVFAAENFHKTESFDHVSANNIIMDQRENPEAVTFFFYLSPNELVVHGSPAYRSEIEKAYQYCYNILSAVNAFILSRDGIEPSTHSLKGCCSTD